MSPVSHSLRHSLQRRAGFILSLFFTTGFLLFSFGGLYGETDAEHIEKLLIDNFQKGYSDPSVRKFLFDKIHPLGTCTSLKVHSVEALDANDQVLELPLKNGQKEVGWRLRLTLYWQGPVTTDGFTKISIIWDTESQRARDCKIIATNGITKEDATIALVQAITALMNRLYSR